MIQATEQATEVGHYLLGRTFSAQVTGEVSPRLVISEPQNVARSYVFLCSWCLLTTEDELSVACKPELYGLRVPLKELIDDFH
jgi:hypothetical protein